MGVAYSSLRSASEGFSARLPMGLIVSRNRSITLTLIRKFFVFAVASAGFGAQLQENGPLGPQSASEGRAPLGFSLTLAKISTDGTESTIGFL